MRDGHALDARATLDGIVGRAVCDHVLDVDLELGAVGAESADEFGLLLFLVRLGQQVPAIGFCARQNGWAR